MRNNKGAISLFALISMVFFLIFIVVAYNNVWQKGKNQVEVESVLSENYKYVDSADKVSSDKNGGTPGAIVLNSKLRGGQQEKKASDYVVTPTSNGTSTVTTYDNNKKYIYSNGEVSKINNDYCELEYIESSGTQYIDTGLTVNQNTKFEMEAMSVTNTNISLAWFGARNASGVDSFNLWQDDNGNFRADFGNKISTIGSLSSNLRYNIYMSKDGIRVNGTNNTLAQVSDFSTNSTFVIFGVKSYNEYNPYNSANSVDYRRISAKVYYAKLWDGSQLVRDFVPCYKVSDGTIGMYDKVEGKFYPNSGTGTFIKGPEIGSYQRVKYIEANGSQYIDSGYKPNQNTGIETQFQFLDVTRQQRVYGCDNDNGTQDNSLSYSLYINGSGYFSYAFKNGNGNWDTSGKTVDTKIHKVQFNVNPVGKWNLDDENLYASSDLASTARNNECLYNLLIMA